MSSHVAAQSNSDAFNFLKYYDQKIEEIDQKLESLDQTKRPLQYRALISRRANFEMMKERFEAESQKGTLSLIDLTGRYNELSKADKLALLERQFEAGLVSEANYLEAKASLQ